MLPESWADPLLDITAHEFRVAIALFCYGSTEDHPAFPSLEKIADKLDCSVRTVRRTLANLEKKGLIKRYRRGTSTSAFTVTDLSAKTVTVLRIPGRDDGKIEHEPVRRVDPLVEHIVKAENPEITREGRERGMSSIRDLLRAHGVAK